MRVSDWGLCIAGSCNLILYIGYILYIVKSLCDINGYVFTIERERRTGHPRVYPTGDRPKRDVPWFSVVLHRRVRRATAFSVDDGTYLLLASVAFSKVCSTPD